MEDSKNIEIMNFGSNITSINDLLVIDKKSGREYVSWGTENNLPNIIYNTYLTCADLQTLVKTTKLYLCGNGITTDFKHYSDTGETFDEVLTRCLFDFILFGNFALEGITNMYGDIVRLNYLDVRKVRLDEELTTAYISNKWGMWSTKNIVKLPLHKKTEKQSHFVFFYRGNECKGVYGVPSWYSGLKSAQTLSAIRDFNLSNILNNFSGSFAVILNGTSIKQREMDEIKQKMELGYTGPDNAGKMLLINNQNVDGKVELQRLQPDNMSNLYEAVGKNSADDLYASFQINKVLVGQNIATGFQAVEFENIYKIYKYTIIDPYRNEIKKCIGKLGVNIDFEDSHIDFA